MSTVPEHPSVDGRRQQAPEPTVGELFARLSEQTSRLVRDEVALAKTELRATAVRAGTGAGLLGGAAVLGLFGFGALVTTAIVALALVLPLWASALIVTGVLLLLAATLGLLGKGQLGKVSPTPERTVSNVKLDVEEVQEARHHERTH